MSKEIIDVGGDFTPIVEGEFELRINVEDMAMSDRQAVLMKHGLIRPEGSSVLEDRLAGTIVELEAENAVLRARVEELKAMIKPVKRQSPPEWTYE